MLNNTRLAHILTILGIAFSQLQFVWLDPQADLPNKICTSIVTLLTLIFTDPTKQAVATTTIKISVALAALVVSQLLTRGTFGTAATSVLTTAFAVFARLPAALSTQTSTPASTQNVVPITEGRAPGGTNGGTGDGELGEMVKKEEN